MATGGGGCGGGGGAGDRKHAARASAFSNRVAKTFTKRNWRAGEGERGGRQQIVDDPSKFFKHNIQGAPPNP